MAKSVLDANVRAIGIEMEGIGAIICAKHLQSRGSNATFLMVRSASDIPDRPDRVSSEMGTRERDEWKNLASAIAADATLQIIAQGLPIGPGSRKGKKMPQDHDPHRSRLPLLEEVIIKADTSVRRFLREDGGVAAACAGDGSGCWTTVSWLEAILMTPMSHLSRDVQMRMTEFLLESQNTDGGWPNVAHAASSPTATGHACCALTLSLRAMTGAAVVLRERIGTALERARWCVDSFFQNPERLSISAVFYLLRSCLVLGEPPRDIATVTAILRSVKVAQMTDGYWMSEDGARLCVSSTARALWLLLHFKILAENDAGVKNALKVLRTEMKDEKGWKISIHRVTTVGRMGETIIHNNSNCDVLNLCRVLSKKPHEFKAACNWLTSTQHEDGSWTLTEPGFEPGRFVPAVSWPTSEFVFTLKSLYNYF